MMSLPCRTESCVRQRNAYNLSSCVRVLSALNVELSANRVTGSGNFVDDLDSDFDF